MVRFIGHSLGNLTNVVKIVVKSFFESRTDTVAKLEKTRKARLEISTKTVVTKPPLSSEFVMSS